MFSVALTLAAVVVISCGQPQAATPTGTGQPTATPTVPSAGPAASPVATPGSGLTDTGYKTPDGSPLHKECVGTNPATGAPLPLPPVYPTPGAFAPLPSPPANPNPEPRPDAAQLPAFDPLTVPASDASAWSRISTACAGGLSFALPPTLAPVDPYSFGQYESVSGGIYATSSYAVKIDVSYSYSGSDDALARFRNSAPGNGTYLLARNQPISVGGVQGLVDVSSEIVGAKARYLVIAVLVNPKPAWYFGVDAFIQPPFTQSAVADVLATLKSVRFAP